MSDTVQKLRVLSRVEIALLKIHLRSLAKQAVLYAAGLLLALLAVAMINAALYLFFVERLDPYVSALIVAVVNAALAAALWAVATRTRPGPEAAMVEEIRDMAVAELQADAEEVRRSFNEVKSDVQQIRAGIGGVFRGGGSLKGLLHLGPLFDVLTKSLKSSRKK